MSAPQIPNLNSLRRGGLRSRGRGREEPMDGAGSGFARPAVSKDDIVRRTDQDAATSRLSAVEAGYLEDPFARLLTPENEGARRLPLMNRGTYVRTSAIDQIVTTFLAAQPSTRKQIISLGAGSDTRYFRIKQKHPHVDLVYHELDFESNTRGKINRLRSPPLLNALKTLCDIDLQSSSFHVSPESSSLASADYFIHPCDLRKLPTSESPPPGVEDGLPTLLISECCLIYLSPNEADSVLGYFTNLFPLGTPLAIVIYEPIRPNDAFGRTMISNLIARGIHLQTLEKYAGLKEQKERARKFGFGASGAKHSTAKHEGAEAADVDYIWRNWIEKDEKERIDGLEWMDEIEEFVLLAKHYCLAWGWRGFTGESHWRDLPSQDEAG